MKNTIVLFDVDETLTPARRVRCTETPCCSIILTNSITACLARDARVALSVAPQMRHWIRSSPPNQYPHPVPNMM